MGEWTEQDFAGFLGDTPIIAAIKTDADLERCIAGDSKIVFILYGDVITIPDIVSRVSEAGKLAFVHIDLVEGLASRDIAVDFIVKNTVADGIISTKANLLRRGKQAGLLTIQRFFILDSLALTNIQKQLPFDYADAIEILPGVMPKVIRKIVADTKKLTIAGGLIEDKEDVMTALGAGAVSVSSTNANIWSL